MKTKIKLLYWKLFKPAKYGAYLELCRLKKEVEHARKLHERVKPLETQYFEMRAIFENM